MPTEPLRMMTVRSLKSPEKKRLLFYVSSALPLLMTVLAYGYSISLPFYLDDLPHFSIIRDFAAGGPESLLFFWGGNSTFPYYRPVMFTVWKGWAWLAGRFDPVGLHLLNVFCYGLTAVLVGLIARRIVRRAAPASGESVAGLIAGVGFALYPFSYQAVTLIAALSHLGLALGATFSFYFAAQWLDGRGAICLPLCWAGAVVGVFSHEIGVMLPPLLAVLIVTLYGFQALRLPRTLWVLIPVASMTGAYLLVWFSIPSRSGLTLFADLFVESLATLAQGLTYPAVALVGRFVAGDAAAAPVLALAALVVLSVWVWLAQTARVLALHAGYGLFWYVLGILPPALLLLPAYVSASPRLTLFSAVGAAIFWGVCAAALWNHKPYRIGRVALAAVTCVTLAVSAHFLRLRFGEFARMSAYTWQLLALTRERNVPGLLLVNPPDWSRPLRRTRSSCAAQRG
jgi:hypothetical protein